MPTRRRTDENLFMTPAVPPDSGDSSRAPSPTTVRRSGLHRTHSNVSDENTPLLRSANRSRVRIQSATDPTTARLSRHQSFNGELVSQSLECSGFLIFRSSGSLRTSRHHGRAGSWGQRLVTALTSERHVHRDSFRESKTPLYGDDRVWYDQFTSTDWVHDSIADAYRVKALRSRKDIRGRIQAFFDGAQGWILSALVGSLTATIAYCVDVSEAPVFDWKDGYCSDGFLLSEKVSLSTYPYLSCLPRPMLANRYAVTSLWSK